MALWNWTSGWDPWSALREAERRMGWQRVAFPPVNVYESGDAFGIEAEVPGVDPKSLEVTVEGNVVTISGMREAVEVRGAVHRQERPVGRFSRSLGLPAAVDSEHVEAQCVDGVLTARLAKAPEARARKITVKSA